MKQSFLNFLVMKYIKAVDIFLNIIVVAILGIFQVVTNMQKFK